MAIAKILKPIKTLIALSTPTNPDRLFPQIKPRSPLNTHKPDRLFPTSNSDRLLTTTKPRSPISHIKQRSPHITHNPDRLFPQHQPAIALLIYIDDYVRINAKQVVEL